MRGLGFFPNKKIRHLSSFTACLVVKRGREKEGREREGKVVKKKIFPFYMFRKSERTEKYIYIYIYI